MACYWYWSCGDDQNCCCQSKKKAYTRKDVVLAAANKDGGAHVDNPDAKLKALQEGFWIRTVTHADGTKKTGQGNRMKAQARPRS